jgi:hypothetical protein
MIESDRRHTWRMVTPTLCMARSAMITVPYLPLLVTLLFRGMPGIWKGRHRLILCGLVGRQALFPGQKTLEELARWTPASLTGWRFRRLLQASYGSIPMLVEWWAQEALTTLPPPKDGTLHLGGDGSEKPKRGTQNPLAPRGRKRASQPWLFGGAFGHSDVARNRC